MWVKYYHINIEQGASKVYISFSELIMQCTKNAFKRKA